MKSFFSFCRPRSHSPLADVSPPKKKNSTERHPFSFDHDQALRPQEGPLRRVRPRRRLGPGPRELGPGRVAREPAVVGGGRLERRARRASVRGDCRVQVRRRPRREDRGVGGRGQPRAEQCCCCCCCRRSVGRDRSAAQVVVVFVVVGICVVKVEERGSKGPGGRGLRALPSGHARRRRRRRSNGINHHGPRRRGVGRRRDQVRFSFFSFF